MKIREYDYIKICLGYPSEEEEKTKCIWRIWNGFTIGTYETGLFGKKRVFAIDVRTWIYTNQFLAPNQIGKKVLTLNLKRKYWEKIRDGKKDWEFREVKKYWIVRLCGKDR